MSDFDSQNADKKLSFVNLLVKDKAHTVIADPTTPLVTDITELPAPLTGNYYINGVPIKPTGLELTAGEKINIKRVEVGVNADATFALNISANYEYTLLADAAGITIETTVPAGVFATYYLIKLPSMTEYHLLSTGALGGLPVGTPIPVLYDGLTLSNFASEPELTQYVSDLYKLAIVNLGLAEKTPEVSTERSSTTVDIHNGPSIYYDDAQTEKITGSFTNNSEDSMQLFMGGNSQETTVGSSTLHLTGGHLVKANPVFVKYATSRNGKSAVNGFYGVIANESLMKISENRTTELTVQQQPNILGRGGVNNIIGYYVK